MLETLHIQNYALIDEIEVDFRGGFNALSGETGAGKSILVGALDLVLGARASSGVLRAGAKRARIEALFRLEAPSRRLEDLVEQHGIVLEENALLLARTISQDGRSRGYAGGNLIPIAVLAAIGDELVDLHGQHEHQSLLKAERQLELLDGFGGTEKAARALAVQITELRALEREIEALEHDGRDRARQIEFLRFEVNEIDAAHLERGEEETLKTRLARITNAETVREHANSAYGLLYGNEDSAAIDALGKAARDLETLAGIDAEFLPIASQLAEARDAIENIAAEVRQFTEAIEYDPAELEELNRRQAMLSGLKRKYGDGIPEILAYRQRAAQELAGYEDRGERLEAMQQERAKRHGEAQSSAQALSKKRRKAARTLDKRVTAALQDLGMKGAAFETRIENAPLAARGIDKAAFLLAANAGETAKPLRQVASGGEVSRIMLALKSVFAAADTIPTLIFDEIDAGVGGTVARKVAAKLGQLANTHQVLCITHIAQIAAAANAHFRVTKHTKNSRTQTRVSPVENEARVQEVARLLDGSLSEVSLEHARTLLTEQ